MYESGSGPASEPETQVMQRFIEREQPRVTLWYHQALRMVVKSTGDPVIERLYSARSGLPRRSLPRYHGTAVSWQNHSFPGDSAFVVELPGGPLPSAGVRRHANAVLAVARAIAPPREVSKPIPFGDERKADMADYAAAPLRHPRLPPARPARDRRALHRHEQLPAGVRLLLAQRARPRAARAAGRLLALRDRPRRDDLPARADLDHVPPHRRPQLDRDRDRARGPERRAGDGEPAPARGLAAADPRAPGPLRHPHRAT